jgi:hypothetical protein
VLLHKLLRRRPTASTLIAMLALFVALGGPAEARRLIDGKLIRRGSITSRQIRDGSLSTRDLSASARGALQAVPPGAVGPVQLAPGAVGSPAIADRSIGAADVALGSVGAAQLAENAVGQREIRANGVGAQEIADNSIDCGEIVDGGLKARDVATYVGQFGATAVPGTCRQAVVSVGPAADIRGDVVVVTPDGSWPDGATYTVRTGPAASQFTLVACRGAGGASVTSTFAYAVIDTA